MTKPFLPQTKAIPPVERGKGEGLEGVGEGVGGGVVGVVDRRPAELDVRVQEAARAAANRLLDFSKLWKSKVRGSFLCYVNWL